MDLSDHIQIADLIVRSFAGDLSVSEEEKLRQWRKVSDTNEELYQQIISLKGLRQVEEYGSRFPSGPSWKNFHRQIYDRTIRFTGMRILKYAALLIPFGLAVGIWIHQVTSDAPMERTKISSVDLPAIKHGSAKAILVLNDGSQLNLDRQPVFTTADAMVKNTGNSGTISYKKKENGKHEGVKMNKLIVPKGGEYNIELSDGTMVYLNAGSELAYPVSFTGAIREVSLKGEAYFKVSRNETCPFVVKTEDMEVRVLGTEFNLNAYKEQKYTATTLVNGRVEINVKGGEPVILEPDHQARFDRETSRMECVKVNTLPYIAWKDGKFVFYHEPLAHITARLEKWYDVNICYTQEDLKELRMFGIISRYEDIRQVLELLRSTQVVDFKYVGGKIEVIPYSLK